MLGYRDGTAFQIQEVSRRRGKKGTQEPDCNGSQCGAAYQTLLGDVNLLLMKMKGRAEGESEDVQGTRHPPEARIHLQNGIAVPQRRRTDGSLHRRTKNSGPKK